MWQRVNGRWRASAQRSVPPGARVKFAPHAKEARIVEARPTHLRVSATLKTSDRLPHLEQVSNPRVLVAQIAE